MKKLLFACLLAFSAYANALDWRYTVIPKAAYTIIPNVLEAIKEMDFPKEYKAFILGQTEQETCPSPTAKSCDNPRATLNTPREYGFGLAQITIACKAGSSELCGPDGNVRFNVFKELQRTPEFKNWSWQNRFDPTMQIKALLYKDKINYAYASKMDMANEFETTAATLVFYNAGSGAVVKARFLCSNKSGCDKSKWFGNLENTNYSRVWWYKPSRNF